MRYLIFVLLFLISCTSEKKFEPDIWRSSRHCKPIKNADKRYLMISDITKNILPNKSKAEIIEILGESLPQQVLSKHKKDLIYCLGRKSGMSMYWLLINFEKSGKANWKIISGD